MRLPLYIENRMWMHKGVRFVTLNFPGPDNGVGHGAATDEEARCRTLANRRWLERAVGESEGPDTRGLVVATQANPWVNKAFAPFLREITAAAQRLRKPVLFVHGDTHIYRFDTPFVDASGGPLANPARLETYGSPFVGWEKVTVDPDDLKLFRVEPMLRAIVRAFLVRVHSVVAVHVAVRELVLRGLAQAAHLRLEPEALAGERMVAVDHDGFGRDVGDGVDERVVLALAGHALEAHADLDRLGEAVARLDAQQLRVVFAEGVLGLERERQLVADVLALEPLRPSERCRRILRGGIRAARPRPRGARRR